MSFLFGTCFQSDNYINEGTFEKELDPRVSLLPGEGKKGEKEPRKAVIIPNKLRARGNFTRKGMVQNYDQLALEN